MTNNSTERFEQTMRPLARSEPCGLIVTNINRTISQVNNHQTTGQTVNQTMKLNMGWIANRLCFQTMQNSEESIKHLKFLVSSCRSVAGLTYS